MSCSITAGRTRPCKDSLGGLTTLYLFNYVKNPFTISNGVVTAINPLLTTVYEYELEGDGNNVVETLTSDRNTGTSVNSQVITAVLKKIDSASALQMNLLAKGFPMAVAVDRNGVYHAIGIDDGIDFVVAQATGGAKTEMNGFTLTGTSTTGSLSPKLNAETIEDFLELIDSGD
jgi:hypothetical protein